MVTPTRAIPAWSAIFAVALPTLVAFNVSPSATFFNQCLATVGWGALLLAVSGSCKPGAASLERFSPGWFALLAACVATAMGIGLSTRRGLPLDAALSSIGMVAGGALVAFACRHVARSTRANEWMTAVCFAAVLTAGFGLFIGCIQVFTPDLADGKLIAAPTLVGRATGNVRQPNHLSTLMLWGCAAAVWLGMRRVQPTEGDAGWAERAVRLLGRQAPWIVAALVLGVMLTASRTGLVGVLMLAVWGVLDRDLPMRLRRALWAAPLVYAAGWLGMSALSHLQGQAFGGEARLHDGSDISSSRFAIWRDTIALIRMEPWAGVGFGQFNFAWTLTPSPQRPVAFFDHTHNIVLQLLVELGLPLGGLVIACLGYALWKLVQQALRPVSEAPAHAIGAAGARVLLYMVLLVGLHSLLEYPLWYAYFLLPTLCFWGMGLAADGGVRAGAARAAEAARPLAADGRSATIPAASRDASAARSERMGTWGMRAGGLAMIVGSLLALADYLRVVEIFTPPAHAAPLEQRIASGQKSVLFGFQADYAKATTEPSPPLSAFERPLHHLIDARLMVAYAKALAAHGQLDKARFVTDRLREFRRFADEPFLDVCAEPLADGEEEPFQCQPYAGRPMDFRDFR